MPEIQVHTITLAQAFVCSSTGEITINYLSIEVMR